MRVIEDVETINFVGHAEDGILVPIELEKQIPFEVKRMFYVFGVNSNKSRGQHAHYKTQQVLICLHGCVICVCKDAYGHEVKACVLGQASAAILAKDVIGKTGREIITVRNAVVTMLNGSKYHPDIFGDYKFLSPARQFKNRHDSILLSLNATVDAINNIFKGVNS